MYCTTSGRTYKNVILGLGNVMVLRKRDSLSNRVGWALVRSRFGDPGLVSRGDNRNKRELFMKQLHTGGFSPQHIQSVGKSQRDGSNTLPLGGSVPAVSPWPLPVLGSIRSNCPLSSEVLPQTPT